jgi:hypothetical protein
MSLRISSSTVRLVHSVSYRTFANQDLQATSSLQSPVWTLTAIRSDPGSQLWLSRMCWMVINDTVRSWATKAWMFLVQCIFAFTGLLSLCIEPGPARSPGGNGVLLTSICICRRFSFLSQVNLRSCFVQIQHSSPVTNLCTSASPLTILFSLPNIPNHLHIRHKQYSRRPGTAG